MDSLKMKLQKRN